MRNNIRSLLFLLAIMGLSATAALAQYSSGIEGTAHDSTGAVVAGATVTVTDTRLGVSKTTTTSQDGYFRIDSIGASNYTVQIQANGFETWRQTNLDLQAGEIRQVTPVLKVGAVSTNITVSAAQQSVDLTTPSTGAVISETTVETVPLPGQNVYALASITPGVTGNAVTSGDNYTNE